jgi:hypothetical protein
MQQLRAHKAQQRMREIAELQKARAEYRAQHGLRT